MGIRLSITSGSVRNLWEAGWKEASAWGYLLMIRDFSQGGNCDFLSNKIKRITGAEGLSLNIRLLSTGQASETGLAAGES